MNAFIRGLCLACALGIALPANAAIKVLATTSDWGSLVTELGGDKVNVYTATSPLQDVHRVDAKPSLVARARSADLVVANGRRTRDWLAARAAAGIRQLENPARLARVFRDHFGAAVARRPDVGRPLDG